MVIQKQKPRMLNISLTHKKQLQHNVAKTTKGCQKKTTSHIFLGATDQYLH